MIIASYALCFGQSKSGKFQNFYPRHCDTKMPMVRIYPYARLRVPKLYTHGVGYGVAVCNERQYQSLDWRNSNSAVPLSFFVYMFAGKNMIFDILDYRKKSNKFDFYRQILVYFKYL